MTRHRNHDDVNPFELETEYEESDILTAALGEALNTTAGRTLLWKIIGECGVYEETFKGNSHDIYEKGRRSIGIWLIEEVGKANPLAYANMLLDAAKEQQRKTLELAEKENDQ